MGGVTRSQVLVLIVSLLSAFAYSCAWGLCLGSLPAVIVWYYNCDNQAATRAVSVATAASAACSAFSAVGLGSLSDAFGASRIAALSSLGIGLNYIYAGLTVPGSFLFTGLPFNADVYFALLILSTFITGNIPLPAVQTLLTDSFAPHLHSRILMAYFTAGTIGLAAVYPLTSTLTTTQCLGASAVASVIGIVTGLLYPLFAPSPLDPSASRAALAANPASLGGEYSPIELPAGVSAPSTDARSINTSFGPSSPLVDRSAIQDEESDAPPPAIAESVGALIASPSILLLLLPTLVARLAESGLQGAFIYYMFAVFDDWTKTDTALVGVAASVSTVLCTLVVLPVLKMSKLPDSVVAVIGIVAAGLHFLGYAVVHVKLLVVLIFVPLAGVSFLAPQAMLAMAVSLADASLQGTVVGIFGAISNVGKALGPLMFGLLYRAAHVETGTNVTAVPPMSTPAVHPPLLTTASPLEIGDCPRGAGLVVSSLPLWIATVVQIPAIVSVIAAVFTARREREANEICEIPFVLH